MASWNCLCVVEFSLDSEATLFLPEAVPVLLQWMVVGIPSPTLQEAGIHA